MPAKTPARAKPKRVVRVPNTLRRVESLLKLLDGLKEQSKAVADDTKKTQDELMAAMKDGGVSTHTIIIGGRGSVTGTVVESTVLDIDYAALQELLTDEQWDKVTKRVVDTKLLESAVALGIVDPMVVDQVSELKPREPYVKVTVK